MENDEIPSATKKQVSEKVMQNLAKANARKKELHEQKRADRSAEKEKTKNQRKIERLKKQLVALVPQQESEEEEEEMVSVKKVKAPPPVAKVPATQYATPKPVKEKAKPTPKPAVEYY